jgi:hypothetical protein
LHLASDEPATGHGSTYMRRRVGAPVRRFLTGPFGPVALRAIGWSIVMRRLGDGNEDDCPLRKMVLRCRVLLARRYDQLGICLTESMGGVMAEVLDEDALAS